MKQFEIEISKQIYTGSYGVDEKLNLYLQDVETTDSEGNQIPITPIITKALEQYCENNFQEEIWEMEEEMEEGVRENAMEARYEAAKDQRKYGNL